MYPILIRPDHNYSNKSLPSINTTPNYKKNKLIKDACSSNVPIGDQTRNDYASSSGLNKAKGNTCKVKSEKSEVTVISSDDDSSTSDDD